MTVFPLILLKISSVLKICEVLFAGWIAIDLSLMIISYDHKSHSRRF